MDKGFGGTVKGNYSLDDALTSCSAIVSKTISLRRKGFTLAEVLITLAIIGVVAALTIPTLVQNYQTLAWDTSAKVFERKLEEAARVMNTQQTLAGYTRTKDFVEELSKHIKITKICDSDELSNCFAEKATWEIFNIDTTSEQEELNLSEIKTAGDLGQPDWDTETIGVQFANGTTGIMAYNPECRQDPYSNQITGTSCIAMVYDTSGYKSPNTTGKDIRGINSIINKCAFKMGSTCVSSPMKYSPLTTAECEQEKSELGITNCVSGTSSPDNWSGAVKACGSVGNMPSYNDLSKILSYIFERDIPVTENEIIEDNNLRFNLDKASKLGWTTSILSAGDGEMFVLSLWANKEIDSELARERRAGGVQVFNYGTSGGFGFGGLPRTSEASAICIY